jgi:hypothetical protein
MNLDELRRLAGINEYKGLQPYGGSNISVTGTEKSEIMKRDNIKPGTDDWFKLWFSLPKMTGEKYLPSNSSASFRGRKK